jgi:hypothetical protein
MVRLEEGCDFFFIPTDLEQLLYMVRNGCTNISNIYSKIIMEPASYSARTENMSLIRQELERATLLNKYTSPIKLATFASHLHTSK